MPNKSAMKPSIKIDHKADHVVIESMIAWNYAEDPASKRVIAVCPALNITLELDAGTELLTTIDNSVKTFFSVMVRDGVLESFLKAKGWIPPIQKITTKTVVNTPHIRIEPTSIDDLAPAACF